MSADRELLELAAKAAGVVHPEVLAKHLASGWNPLTDDGDALRLAVKLCMSVEISEYEASTYAYVGSVPRAYAIELWREDRSAATRRAIVRAAAESAKAV